MSPKLFIYTNGKNGEDTWLVDAYEKKASGDVELFRSDVQGPIIILGPDDISSHFIVLEWTEVISSEYMAEDFEIEADENGDVYLNVALPTVH